MRFVYKNGLKDFTKVEEMYRLSLDCYEKSLGKDNKYAKNCARNLATLLKAKEDKEKTSEVVAPTSSHSSSSHARRQGQDHRRQGH